MWAERLEVGNGGWCVVEMSQLKIMPMFQKAICKYLISNPFHRLGSAVPLCQKKA